MAKVVNGMATVIAPPLLETETHPSVEIVRSTMVPFAGVAPSVRPTTAVSTAWVGLNSAGSLHRFPVVLFAGMAPFEAFHS